MATASSSKELEARDEELPDYADAVPSTQAGPANAADVPNDEPPAYTQLDTNPTHFTIQGSFISTPSGPYYQLSSALDQRGYNLLLRRLRPKEIQQAISPSAPALGFDKGSVLYEIYQAPISHALVIQGKRKSTVAGEIKLRSGVRHWYVEHKGKEILSLKVGSGLSALKGKKKEEDSREWKGEGGVVLGREGIWVGPVGEQFPVLELVDRDMDAQMRELLITVWTARLWVVQGQRKSAEESTVRASFAAIEHSKMEYLGKGF